MEDVLKYPDIDDQNPATQTWTRVVVPRSNLYGWTGSLNNEIGNKYHWELLKEWCEANVPPGAWSGQIVKSLEYGHKLFKFQDPQFALLFRLKWL